MNRISEYLRPVLYAARRAFIEIVYCAFWATVAFVALWSFGAAWGLVALGYRMMAGC